jgi:hypothetical protein
MTAGQKIIFQESGYLLGLTVEINLSHYDSLYLLCDKKQKDCLRSREIYSLLLVFRTHANQEKGNMAVMLMPEPALFQTPTLA